MTVNSKELFYTVDKMNSLYFIESGDVVKLLNNANLGNDIVRTATFIPCDGGFEPFVRFNYENVVCYASDSSDIISFDILSDLREMFVKRGVAMFEISIGAMSSEERIINGEKIKLFYMDVDVDYSIEDFDTRIIDVLSNFFAVDEIIQEFSKDPYALDVLDFTDVDDVIASKDNPIINNIVKDMGERDYLDNDAILALVKGAYLAGRNDGTVK